MKRSSKSFDPGIILLLVMVLILIAAGLFLYSKVRVDKFDNILQKEEPASFMLIIYEGESILFSDILLYQDSTGKGALVDIPPNTGSLLKEHGKIDSIETIFNPQNPEPYMRKVSEIAGIPFDYYLILDLEELSSVVDLISGVETFIANPVDTKVEDTIVLLPSGSFLMDGSKAAAYIKYGDPGETESETISRGQSFFQSLLHGIGKAEDRLRNSEVRQLFAEKVNTDISVRGLIGFASAMKNLDAENMVLLRLRGTEREVDEKELLFPHSEGRLLRETLSQTINSLKSESLLTEDDLRVALEIRNGAAVNGLASRTSQLYQSFGYDVARVGNAKEDYEKNSDYRPVRRSADG